MFHSAQTISSMRKHVTTALLLLLSSVIFSQTHKLDSLKSATTAMSGLQKVNALLHYAEQAAWLYPDAAKPAAEEALRLARSLNDPTSVARALDLAGGILQQKMDYTRAMQSYLEALKIRELSNDNSGRALSRVHVGRLFYLMEDYTHAEEYLVTALDFFETSDNNAWTAHAHEYLGDTYLARRIFGKAQEQYRLAIDLKRSANDATGAAKTATRLGHITMDLGDHEGASRYFRTALDLYRELGDSLHIAQGHNNIALALLGQKDYVGALRNGELAAGIRQSLADTFGMAESAKNIGHIYLAKGESDKAKQHYHQSAEWLEQIPLQPETPEIWLDIAEGLAQLGEPTDAYRYHRHFADARNALLNQEKAKALLDLTTKYESEFAAREQQQRIEMLELEKGIAVRTKYYLLLVIGLIGVLLATLFASYRRKQQDNRLLLAKNEEIARQRDEINSKNEELQLKNTRLDLLNKKLVEEMAERENIEKSSFARDRFLATMSHEMRTPINIINGLTHILLESNPRPEQADQLRTLQYAANDLIVFINDVLDFSKIEAGKLNLEDRAFGPAATFLEIKQKFEDKAASKNLGFSYYFDKKIPEKLLGDNARLHQILTYLLANTFLHTAHGKVNIDIALESLNPRQAMLKICIEGTDGGLGRNLLDKALKSSDSETVSELTLGDSEQLSLTIAKRLVELQNGKFEVAVLPSISTSFVIWLPFKTTDGKAETPAPQTKSTDYGYLAGSRILVVEDNKINQLVVAKILRKLGIQVETANNGLEALELYERQQFDLILMDIQMPVMDGYRATAEIRTHPVHAKRNVPIIALTASAFLTEKEKAVLFGMNDHVGKPFSPDELLEKINLCLSVYRDVS